MELFGKLKISAGLKISKNEKNEPLGSPEAGRKWENYGWFGTKERFNEEGNFIHE